MEVTFKTEVIAVEDRRVRFRVEAFDAKEQIADGTHERFIVNVERFAKRLAEKNAALPLLVLTITGRSLRQRAADCDGLRSRDRHETAIEGLGVQWSRVNSILGVFGLSFSPDGKHIAAVVGRSWQEESDSHSQCY